MPNASNDNDIRFDGLTAVITGAGGGLGRTYALFLAARGAAILVNDVNPANAKAVVDQIVSAGGRAAANSDSVVDAGARIVDAAVRAFNGRIDILINNAGILRDKSFARMSHADWDAVIAVHLRGAYSVTKAAWPLMLRQRYGRIINTASAAGIYGNVGQANYSAAKLALHGFTLSLAREGAKSNILCNSIAPLAASQMTATVMPPEILEALKPELVSPFVAYLVHSSCVETGSIFEVGAGYAAKLRRQRAAGVSFGASNLASFSSILPDLKLAWPTVTNFAAAGSMYPPSAMDTDWMGLLEKSIALKSAPAKSFGKNSGADAAPFLGKVVIVTGAGAGIGRAYALLFGRLGANVVVNDVSKNAADAVVNEIKAAGPGSAVANSDSVVEFGERIVETALKNYGGRIDVLVNNAGILRDKSFAKMTDADWDDVIRVHLNGTFKVSHAVWPHMMKNKFGRIINTTSAIGLYGNFGQANYAAAKAAIIALTCTLAHEGKRHNICVNAIAPNAGTSMTATVMPKEMVDALKPDFIAPFVAFLAHQSSEFTGGVYECGSGWIAAVRWERAGGHMFSRDPVKMTPESVRDSFAKVCDFNKSRATYPTSAAESFQSIYSLVTSSPAADSAPEAKSDLRVVNVDKARASKFPAVTFNYSERDVILYALGIGATRNDLQWVYENSPNFHALPSFGVIYMFAAMGSVSLGDFIGDFNPMQLVHGEQYLELHVPQLPVSGKVVSEPTVVDIQDKGKGALVILGVKSFDAASRKLLAYSESSLFIRGMGNFKRIQTANGGANSSMRRGPPAGTSVPQNAPDAVKTCKTSPSQAALYRLSGDMNPLHIDSEMSKLGGFKVPILHGLCTLGFGVRHVYSSFAPKNGLAGNGNPIISNIQCRMSAHVFPGETLTTEMWQVSPTRVVFQVRVAERQNKVVISNAAVDFTQAVNVIQAKPESLPSKHTQQGGKSDGVAAAIFNGLSASLSRLPAASRIELTRRLPAIYEFNVSDDSGSAKRTWTLDLKSTLGAVVEGTTVPASVPDNTLVTFNTDTATLQRAFQGNHSEAAARALAAGASGNRSLVDAFPRVLDMLGGRSSRL